MVLDRTPTPPPRIRLALAFTLVSLGGCRAPAWLDAAPPLWIAHRGNSAELPENTLAAVVSALALRPPPAYVEIDLRSTADGELIVLHDESLDRTTDASGDVSSLSWEEVKNVSAGYPARFGGVYADERVPQLDEVLDLVRDSPVGLMIEIKEPGLAALVAERLVERGEVAQHLIASSSPAEVEEAARRCTDIRTLLLVRRPGPEDVQLAKSIGATHFGSSASGLSEDLVEASQAEGLEVFVYTVNDRRKVRRFKTWGVNGIITDQPGRMANWNAHARWADFNASFTHSRIMDDYLSESPRGASIGAASLAAGVRKANRRH